MIANSRPSLAHSTNQGATWSGRDHSTGSLPAPHSLDLPPNSWADLLKRKVLEYLFRPFLGVLYVQLPDDMGAGEGD